jgi:N-methylhydantoinase A
VVLGRIGTTRTLGGTITIDRDAAARVVEALGARVGLDRHAAADGIVRIAVARMVSSIREVSIQRGHDPRDFTLIAFGGAGPMHAVAIAEELGIPRILVPRYPGNFSALGLLVSDLKHDDVRTVVGPLRARLDTAETLFGEMERSAVGRLESDGFGEGRRRLERSLDVRYAGQAFEIAVPVTAPLDAGVIEREFHRRHEIAYGHANPTGAVEVVNARLAAYGVVDKPEPALYEGATRRLDEALIETRDTWFGGGAIPCPVYDRDRLPVAATVSGPAIVEEFGATTVLPPGWRAALDRLGNLFLEPA